MTAYLVDTNVLVYAYDPRDHAKLTRAREVLRVLAGHRRGALTAQVLGEFYVVVTRKLKPPLTVAEAQRSITTFLRTWTVYDVTGWMALEAARGAAAHSLSYWDAQIWAAARLHGVPNLLSQDMDDGALIEGVRIVNPFRPDFSPSILAAG